MRLLKTIEIDRCIVFFFSSGRRIDQPDHLLYQIDVERPLGSSSPTRTDEARLTRKQRAELDLNKLNSYKILEPHSSVPPILNEFVNEFVQSTASEKNFSCVLIVFKKKQIQRRSQQSVWLKRNKLLNKENRRERSINVRKSNV